MAGLTATDRDVIVSAISAALSEVLDYELPQLTEDSRLFDELGLDSTGVFEMLMRLEEALDIEFDTDSLEMAHFTSVRTLADFIAAEMGS
ncbi:Acyl carrier protein [Streptomyces hundungensis]|uniref:Acyl carrier protein n=1 Tax=Streptomyces hundungensis TaxID=1077946 RepID=A0A387HIS1_9ACTN|nr:acyl carrier protein [Streptomyces hundungensis]AYG80702.1 Acyl carrier protein [Streptomyces hundungensis]